MRFAFAVTPFIEPQCSRTLPSKPGREASSTGKKRQHRRELEGAPPRHPILSSSRWVDPKDSGFVRELPGEVNELVELTARGARVDRAGRQLDPLLQVARLGSDDQRGGRVHQHDIAARSRVAGEDGPDDLGVLLAIAPEEIADRGARQAEVLGPDGGRPDDALADLGDAALAGVRDLVEVVAAVHDERPDRDRKST